MKVPTLNQDHVPCSFAYKLVCVDDKFSKEIVLCRGENAAFKFIEIIVKVHEYCRIVIKNILRKIWSWKKTNNNFNWVALAGFVKNELIMMMNKLEIIVT